MYRIKAICSSTKKVFCLKFVILIAFFFLSNTIFGKRKECLYCLQKKEFLQILCSINPDSSTIFKNKFSEHNDTFQKKDFECLDKYEIDSLKKNKKANFSKGIKSILELNTKNKILQNNDSISIKKEVDLKTDTLKNSPKFTFTHWLFEYTLPIGKKAFLKYKSPLKSILPSDFYNSVEGYYINTTLEYTIKNLGDNFEVYTTKIRYSLGRERFTGEIKYTNNHLLNDRIFEGKIGSFANQFNENGAISAYDNVFYSLFLSRNYIKLFQKEYINFVYHARLNKPFSLKTGIEIAQRSPLENNHFHSWIKFPDRKFTSNVPINSELKNTAFKKHTVAIVEAKFIYQPLVAKKIANNIEKITNKYRPTFSFIYKMGVEKTKFQFGLIEFQYAHKIDIFKIGVLETNITYGNYLKKPSYFIDFKHFSGNLTMFSSGTMESSRMLDYYNFSTAYNYFEIHTKQNFNNFLFTRIPIAKKLSINEYLFGNYTSTFKQNNHYGEFGYGLEWNHIGFEIANAFLNNHYIQTAFRLRLPF